MRVPNVRTCWRDGDQPDHRSGGMPIRHWDGFWFGKRHLYGDTMHYHAGLSASCYFSAYRVLGDPTLLERGRRCFRNLLFLFRGDGWGSAAYYLPLSVTMLNPDGSAPISRG